jgi:RNA polymerase sigma-32 factor
MTNVRLYRKSGGSASPRADPAASLLGAEEERDLAIRAGAGDPEAMSRVIDSHLRFVVKIARSYRGWGLPMSDLVQEGTLGLIRAVRRFDPDRGTRLSTYAAWSIQAAVQDAALRSWSVVRLGTSNAQKSLALRFKKMMAAVGHEDSEIGEEVAAGLAARFGVTIAEVVAVARRMAGGDRSLDRSPGQSLPAIDSLRSPTPSPESVAQLASEQRFRSAALAAALAKLSLREQLVIRRRYFAEGRPTFAAIGRELGVSKDRARQLEAKALAKLREILGDSLFHPNA